jgi:hypothetical protein
LIFKNDYSINLFFAGRRTVPIQSAFLFSKRTVFSLAKCPRECSASARVKAMRRTCQANRIASGGHIGWSCLCFLDVKIPDTKEGESIREATWSLSQATLQSIDPRGHPVLEAGRLASILQTAQDHKVENK